MMSLGPDRAYLSADVDGIRDVIERMNRTKSGQQFQIVIGENGRVVGTVTDGDIRRAILRNVSLDGPVTQCMQQKFMVGKVGDAAGNRRKLQAIQSNVHFLPIVDDNGILKDILVASPPGNSNLHALIMAGGFGRRMGARTANRPKPLLPVGGRPIIEHIIERLRLCGIQHISISVHYLAEQIEDFVRSQPDQEDISIIHENEPLGTAGAVRMIENRNYDHLLVSNGDILTSLQFNAFADFHVEQGNAATIAAATHEVRIPYGVIEHTETGLFRGIAEKPVLSHFVSAGINLLSRDICRLVPELGPLDMPDLIRRGHAAGMRIGVFPIHEYWTDVGRPEDFDRADAIYRNPQEGAN